MMMYLLGVLLMLMLSAFFSGTEIAYASSNELRLRRASDNGRKAQTIAYWIYSHFEDALITILIGNNLVNTTASSLMTVFIITLLGSGFAWLATLIVTLLVLIFGEITPKQLAKAMPEKIATLAAYPLRGLMWLLHPLVWLVQRLTGALSRLMKTEPSNAPSFTEADIEVFLDTAEDEGAIDGDTTELLQSALVFDDMRAYEIITPRVDMIAIDIDDPMNEIIDTALSSPYSRIPVYEDSKDNIIGLLHLTRFLKQVIDDPEPDLREMLLPACYVTHNAVLPSVLAVMRQRKQHLVIVVDEYGGTLGLLTMEDILEELVGDIWDETDEIDAELILLPDGQYLASGDMRVADLLDTLDIDEKEFSYESTTLGGWATETLGATPKVGDAFTYGRLHVEVSAVRKTRVTKLKIGISDEHSADAALA